MNRERDANQKFTHRKQRHTDRSSVDGSSSPPRDGEIEGEHASEGYDDDMHRIKKLQDMLIMLQKMNDELKHEKADLVDEVKNLKEERKEVMGCVQGDSTDGQKGCS